MICINLDTTTEQALVPIKKRGEKGYELVDVDTAKGMRAISRLIGKKVGVILRGTDEGVDLILDRHYTYEELLQIHQTQA